MGLWLDGLVAAVLLGTSVARSNLQSLPPRGSRMIELFHATNDEGSAEARKRVVDRSLVGQIRFRNVFYPEVRGRSRRARRHDARRPIWDGEQLVQGRDAVLAFLSALK